MRKRSDFLPALIAVPPAAAMLYWGTGLHPVWWLTWLAPLPLLIAALRSNRGFAFLIASGTWFLGSLNMWHYLLRAIELPLALVFLASLLPSCMFGVAVLLFRHFARRGEPALAAWAFPAFWTAYEFLSASVSPHGTFGNLGYTQVDLLPVLQIVSIAGIWGISFCLFLFSGAVAILWSPKGTASGKKITCVSAAILLAPVFGFGFWRLHATQNSPRVRVGMTATGVNSTFPSREPEIMALLREYSAESRALAAQGAQVVVLPEKIALLPNQLAPIVDDLFATASANAAADIVVGLDRGSLKKRFNEARLYEPSSGLTAVYVKHHLVPGFEDADQPGTEIRTFDRPSGRWGMQICKDMDFPSLSRRYGVAGVGLLLVPAWDFTLDSWLHSRMAVMRGVESGFSIARASKQGALTISDNRGRIIAERDASPAPRASLAEDAPVLHSDTLYVRWGDWFGWLNAAAVLAFLCRLIRITLFPKSALH